MPISQGNVSWWTNPRKENDTPRIRMTSSIGERYLENDRMGEDLETCIGVFERRKFRAKADLEYEIKQAKDDAQRVFDMQRLVEKLHVEQREKKREEGTAKRVASGWRVARARMEQMARAKSAKAMSAHKEFSSIAYTPDNSNRLPNTNKYRSKSSQSMLNFQLDSSMNDEDIATNDTEETDDAFMPPYRSSRPFIPPTKTRYRQKAPEQTPFSVKTTDGSKNRPVTAFERLTTAPERGTNRRIANSASRSYQHLKTNNIDSKTVDERDCTRHNAMAKLQEARKVEDARLKSRINAFLKDLDGLN